MKKNARKLVLHRETLHSLELRGVSGGATAGPVCNTMMPCGTGGTGTCDNTYDTCQATLFGCSNYCATGGACTTSCP